jgi:hypothetical protein
LRGATLTRIVPVRTDSVLAENDAGPGGTPTAKKGATGARQARRVRHAHAQTTDPVTERLDGLRGILGEREGDDDMRQNALLSLACSWDKPSVPDHAWDGAALLMAADTDRSPDAGLEPDFVEAVCRLIDSVDLLQTGGFELEWRHVRTIDTAYAGVGAAIDRWKAQA